MKVAIIGQGFVGTAVQNALTCETVVADPAKNGKTAADLNWSDIDAGFVCVPTPCLASGAVDPSYVLSAVQQIPSNVLVVLKSTITPDHLAGLGENVVYNPEFLTQANANQDMLDSKFLIIGGSGMWAKSAAILYRDYSKLSGAEIVYTTRTEAALVKYAINSFLASKVVFFNEFSALCDQAGADYSTVARAIARDPRMGSSHMQVPGPDGLPGFGGACFPKDTSALLAYSGDGVLDVLAAAVAKNAKLRP